MTYTSTLPQWFVVKGNIVNGDSMNYLDEYFQNTPIVGPFLDPKKAQEYLDKQNEPKCPLPLPL